ncbi:reverse transcriptase domain-containing protein [Tanacetum coccineum]
MSRAYYNKIREKSFQARRNPYQPYKFCNFVGRANDMHIFIGCFIYVVDFMILEDLGSIIDSGLSEVVLGQPFAHTSKLTYDESLGLIRFAQRDDEVVFRMPQRTKELDLVSSLEKDKFEAFFVENLKVVPKKGGMTVLKNEKDELIPQRTVTEWRVCIYYRKLNNATRKDNFSLPFINQMLEQLAGHEYYCFLDGFSRYFQIPIAPEDQEKTMFTCPYRTFAYKRMPFGLCNAPTTFQRCMTTIFHELIEDSMEVFMDDFSIFGSSFDHCLKNLEKMLKRCEETNLVLNWEKCHFMVKEGIVLGHKVLGSGIEEFYKRFNPQIARPKNPALVKDSPFNFSEECIKAIDTLKRKLTQAPIMIKPDWSLPFEIINKYVVVAIDYVSNWVEARAFPTNDARNVVNFLKRLFTQFGIPKALISDRDTHFCNHQMEKAMKRYGVVHRFSTAYHPQTNGQVENTNRALKLFSKKTIRNNRKDWSYKLDDALWAFRTAFKKPLGMTLFRIIYDKACHLPVKLEHKAY